MANEIAYGFVSLRHLFDERVATENVPVVQTAIQQSAEEHTRQINALLNSIAFQTTEYKERFQLPGTGTLQPIDAQYGIPRPVREAGFFDVAYPLRAAGTAFGDNRVSRAYMTVADANRMMVENQKRDTDWLRRHMMAAMLDNVGWTFSDDEHGNLDIVPLANDDSVVYVKRDGTTATDDHYLAQGDNIDDSNNPFPTIYKELTEHPGNEGPVVVYVASDLVSDITGLAGFLEPNDPAVRVGANNDELVQSVDVGVGHELIGRVDRCWIVEWENMPSGYMLGHARGAGPAVGMREHGPAELRGFFVEQHSPDGNIQQTSMLRMAGFGVRNRLAALAYQIGNATYNVPSGFDAPLDV